MSLIAMAVHDTSENRRSDLTRQTLACLRDTVDWSKHRLVISDNGSCDATLDILRGLSHLDKWGEANGRWSVIYNGENLGTARAINKVWQQRVPGEHCVKIDNDIEMTEPGWLDTLERCLARDPTIGIIGLKRKDLAETPAAPVGSWNHSTLRMLPHTPGEQWLIVEAANHVMGTCQLYNSALLDKIGFLVQDGLYGYDDALAAVRCHKAGFYSAFYCHYPIDHPDPGTTPYQGWKEQYAAARGERFQQLSREFRSGKRPVYCGPEEVL